MERSELKMYKCGSHRQQLKPLDWMKSPEEMRLEQQPRLSPGAFQQSDLGRSGGTRKDQLVRLRAKREYVLEGK